MPRPTRSWQAWQRTRAAGNRFTGKRRVRRFRRCARVLLAMFVGGMVWALVAMVAG